MRRNTKLLLGIIIVGIVIIALGRVYNRAPHSAQELPQEFKSARDHFSIRLPLQYTADEAYIYESLGPGREIGGVKFTIPEAMTLGTNLSPDTYISVESMSNAEYCAADIFLDIPGSGIATDGNQLAASSTSAAAGNRYEEWVYALRGTNPCIAVRYYIHYGAIENYPEGTVKRFDKEALDKEFDAIRQTLVVAQ